MRKKIVITGALGYLGTELCKLYSGYSWDYEVIALDSRFVSERVHQLKVWKIRFFQTDILKRSDLKEYLKDADIVFHLAGVTDVAYLKKDSDKQKDKKIREVAIRGTQNILDFSSSKTKIIFPSTHVIFEGLKDLKKDITEKNSPSPVLVYSKSKLLNEEQIKNSNKNYIILRLGSVYGYSSDTMRLSIMPNLFSKIASQNGEIKLFAAGTQFKSLVSVIDVVRCFKFMEERNDLEKETYNLVNENLQVRDVAKLCKKINPKLKIVLTKDLAPNKGYTLSNNKLKKTGFKFLYNLNNSLKDMIEKWSYKEFENDLEYKFKGEKEFIDERGEISNYELPEPINLIGYITSKKKSVRANHYHPVQQQKCLLVKGQFISIYKDLIKENSIKVTHIVNEKQMIVTQPNTAHAMVFSKNSIFLNLVTGEREHSNYGITHTIPHQLVDESERKMLLKFYKFKCRCCDSENLERVLSLGYQPLANNLLNSIDQVCHKYPLELNVCKDCFNCQLSLSIDEKKMFKNYLYQSSTAQKFRQHFKIAANQYIREFKLDKKKSYIIDVGSNDGIGLKPFKELGYKNILGIEPAKNLSEIANKQGIRTFNAFLNKKNIKKLKKNADLVLASNVFAHADDLRSMAECMLSLLKKNGTLIIEVQYFLDTLKDLTFDNIYHEHMNYWTLTSLSNFFYKLQCTIYKVEKITTHGGSIRVYVSKNKDLKIQESVKKILKEEIIFGINNISTYKDFGKKIEEIKKTTIVNLQKIKKKYKKIIGYGAPAKASTLLNYFNIVKDLDFTIEDNDLKIGKYIPGVNLEIKNKNVIFNHNSCILVLAWNFFNEIKLNNKKISKHFYNIKELGSNKFRI
jgi:nucleoside-diphosphate-sugar epimerase/SAM-dependent methyltransferase